MDRRQWMNAVARRPPDSAAATAAPDAPAPADPRRGFSEAEARDLSQRILQLTNADEARVNLSSGWDGNTRYAVNRITTAGEVQNARAAITARFGRREAAVSTNRFDDASLRDAVAKAERLARLAPEDPEIMPELAPQNYRDVTGYVESTASLEPADRTAVAAHAIERARERDLVAAGFLEVDAGAGAVANSNGLFAYHPSTAVDYTITARTADGRGSGWAMGGHRDWSRLDVEWIHARAMMKAVRSREPRPLEPGTYPAILEPAAVDDMIGLLSRSLDARRAHEGRSAFARPDGATAVGERILDPAITLRSDPVGLGSSPFMNDGLPLTPVTWVQNGVLRQLSYDRYWADRRGAEPTGYPGSLRMEGGPRSLEELIANTERAVLVTRMWYIRSVDPRTILYTGLTRDGTFWVENGEIQYPVNNFRWNESPLTAFSEVTALSRPVRVSASREVPAALLPAFHFSSVSEAV